jgi:hypothetical protein
MVSSPSVNEETAIPGRPSTSDAARTERRLDVLATVLLALATLATAWSAYQARQWTGEQSQGYSQGTAARIAANRAAALAGGQQQIDIATFVQWLDARAQHLTDLAAFYRERFRAEFTPAFAAWLAARPFGNRDAPPTPFAMPQYRLKAAAQADRLEATAAAASERAKEANQRADNYMLAVVLFASALFFAGISIKLRSPRLRIALLALGWILFLGTVIWLATLPAKVTI